MKKEILLLLTMFCIICLTAFTTTDKAKKNHNVSNTIKTRPTVTINYPSDFSRYLFMNLKKKHTGLNNKTRQAGPYFAYYWWDFNGAMSQQGDPTYYSYDGDNYPDCATMSGNTYCEIRALPDYPDDSQPDLYTIIGSRYLPIQ